MFYNFCSNDMKNFRNKLYRYNFEQSTYYNIDENGISSKYKKFSKLWWHKRSQAFTYLRYILTKKKKSFIISFDYIITLIICRFLI